MAPNQGMTAVDTFAFGLPVLLSAQLQNRRLMKSNEITIRGTYRGLDSASLF